MTKKEIYKYLKYNGVYDSGVKRRLKKLIKQYHPDRNKGDDTVMKLINEVKKELESGNVSVNVDSNTSDVSYSNKNSVDIINISSIISKLNKELVSLNKKIEDGYKNEYKLFIEYNNAISLYNTLKLNERLIKSKIVRLKRFRGIDKLNIFLLLVSIGLIFKSIYFSIMSISIIYLEVVLILIRYFKIKRYKEELNSINKMDREYKEFSNSIKDKIDILNKDLFGVKKDARVNKEKIRYYEKMMNDSSSDTVKKEKTR